MRQSGSGRLALGRHRLFDETLLGLRQAVEQTALDGIAIDTWGVDYGLLGADGTLLGDPFSYRDERTLPMVALGEDRLAADRLYGLTGCQAGPINTLYQLLADQHSRRLDSAERLLLTPDLFGYWLTGEIGADETIASTTQLFDPVARDWSWDAIDAMGLPRRMFPPVRRTGMILGQEKADLGRTGGDSGHHRSRTRYGGGVRGRDRWRRSARDLDRDVVAGRRGIG